MNGLETLLKEEESVIGAELEGQRLAQKSGLPAMGNPDIEALYLLPHMKHQPYFNMLISRASQLSVKKAVALGFDPEFQWFLQRSDYRDLHTVTERIRQKYGVYISEDEIGQYLVSFAGRILEYAKAHLQGVLANEPTISGIVQKHTPDEAERLLQQNPKACVAIYVQYIQRFYDSAMS